MPRQKGKALGLLPQEACAQVAVTDTDLSVVCDRTRDAEGLQAETDFLRCVGSCLYTVLNRDCRADDVGPTGIFKTNWLNALYQIVYINPLVIADLLGLFDRSDAVLVQLCIDLVDSSFIAFK